MGDLSEHPPLLNKAERPSEPVDLRRRLRQQEYTLLCAIQDKIRHPRETPSQLDYHFLGQLPIVLGAPLDVDDHNPIDLEPRFFLAGEACIEDDGLRVKLARQLEPIDFGRLKRKRRPAGCQELARQCLDDARGLGRCCEAAAWKGSRWNTHRYVAERGRPEAREMVTPTPEATDFHYFAAGSYRMWPRGLGWKDWTYDPDVPHAIGTVYDMATPRDGAILRSELLFAVSLLKASISDTEMFIDHKTCPVLVVSFHGRFSARILQVHLEKGDMVIRPSRLLQIRAGYRSQDLVLVVGWLSCKPVGDTRWMRAESTQQEDEAAAVRSERREPPTHAMAVTQPG